MRAQRATRLAAASAVGILMAGGAAIGTAGPAAAAAPAVHTHVATDMCGNWGQNCFNGRGFRFDHGFRFNHGFDHGFGFNHGFRFDNRFGFDHQGFFNPGGAVIIVL
ncbi:hypothetical protein AB0E10_13120 [Streptomyces sp. NPDC048045]|uniref:hypothetical protein n=1 Tax=Streptomyces sp. NPDC048045 TaxID=3154710 RepID=UPI00343E4593